MKRDPLLSVNDLNIYLNNIAIVQNVSFNVYPNECIGIVGESGSGKSLTAHAIAGLCKLKKTGSVHFKNCDLLNIEETDLRHQLINIGFIFQNPQGALNPLMKAGLQIQETHSSLTKEEILNLLKDLGLKDPLKCFNSYPHELSGGMCQRVMIAIALAKNPQLIIADEPTTALDVSNQTQILNIFKSFLKNKRASLILISHDFNVIEKVCDKIVVMYAGEIIEAGPCIETINNPKHPYTKALLSAIPSHHMNKNHLLKSIPGTPPSLLNKSPLCSFYPRCEHKDEKCLLRKPDLIAVADRHVACFNSSEM